MVWPFGGAKEENTTAKTEEIPPITSLPNVTPLDPFQTPATTEAETPKGGYPKLPNPGKYEDLNKESKSTFIV
jgi:hypothetical protein